MKKNILVIIIFVLLIVLLAFAYLYFDSKKDSTSNDDNSITQEQVEDAEDEDMTVAEVSGVKLSIDEIVLNDNRDRIDEVAVRIEPLEDRPTRQWKANTYIKRNQNDDGEIIATYNTEYEFIDFKNLSGVSLNGIDFYSSWWEPGSIRSGEYVLVIEIRNPSNNELLATIQKNVTLGHNVPKIQ